MKVFLFMIAFLLCASQSFALENPENYTTDIAGVNFYPGGAKFIFNAVVNDNDGNFKAVIPGSFAADSIRVANPDDVYGDIKVVQYQRTRWTPKQLENLKNQLDEQNVKISGLNAKKAALEQTLALLEEAKPDKSKPAELLEYIKNAQELRLNTETELSAIKITISKEQEIQKMLSNELNSKRPKGENNYIVVTGQAAGAAMLEAFTSAASWSPKYILNLNSETGSLDVSMYIRASQKTGLDYEGDMTLHTKTPDEKIITPVINPLRVGIKPKEELVGSLPLAKYSRNNRMYESARADMMMMEDTLAEDEDDDFEAPKTPAVKETLSDRTIDIDGFIPGDGTEREFEVVMNAGDFKSTPLILLVPEQRNKAWIIASMDENNEHLIPGDAELRVDNHVSGKIYLEEYGKGQKMIPFGYAEQITVKKEALIEKKGVSWFSGVFNSGYKLEITNGTKTEKIITVKDRLPIPTDEKIKLDVKRIEPKEKERDTENRLTWEITVPAGATVPIIVDYALSYPSGEELLYR